MKLRPMTWGEVHTSLTLLKERGPTADGSGICYNFECRAIELYDTDSTLINDMGALPVLFAMMGVDRHYPVQHPTLTADDAYDKVINLWNKSHQYGRNRWAFLDRLIDFAAAQPQEESLPTDP